jgi:hypothetical protein
MSSFNPIVESVITCSLLGRGGRALQHGHVRRSDVNLEKRPIDLRVRSKTQT